MDIERRHAVSYVGAMASRTNKRKCFITQTRVDVFARVKKLQANKKQQINDD
jgi:hypothetical protein